MFPWKNSRAPRRDGLGASRASADISASAPNTAFSERFFHHGLGSPAIAFARIPVRDLVWRACIGLAYATGAACRYRQTVAAGFQPANRVGIRAARCQGSESPYGVTPKAGLSNFTPLRTA